MHVPAPVSAACRSGRRRRGAAAAASAAAVTAAVVLPPTSALADAGADIQTITGELPDGAEYLIEVPGDWNGTVALFGHGLVFPGEPNPAVTAPSDASHDYLLAAGVALAGSSYATTGWAMEAVDDQLATLDVLRAEVGEPIRTIAWGESLGGMISLTLAEEHADEIDAAMPICGLLAGATALWNSYLDAQFVMTTLLSDSAGPQLVHIEDPIANIDAALAMLTAAEATPDGRARIALAAAMAQVPGRIDPNELTGTPSDVESRTQARIDWIRDAFSFLAFGERADLEARLGGNPSTNLGVDYERQLLLSRQDADVRAVYEAAGLDLTTDLQALAAAPRIAADPDAVALLGSTADFTGALDVPVLTLHNVADGLAPSSHERAYLTRVRDAGDEALVRQLFVKRAGHCTVTSAEIVTGFEVLLDRLDSGRWADLRPGALNVAAADLGPELNSVEGTFIAPVFTPHTPLPFPRTAGPAAPTQPGPSRLG